MVSGHFIHLLLTAHDTALHEVRLNYQMVHNVIMKFKNSQCQKGPH